MLPSILGASRRRLTLTVSMLLGASQVLLAQAPAVTHKLPTPVFGTEFRYDRHQALIDGVGISYVDEGARTGNPVLFIHGNPTSSYLWRNVLPYASELPGVRAIALDLPGMGASTKLDPPPGYLEHLGLLERFIESLDLWQITLVVHDWGAALGFDYARLHPERIRGVVFMEGVLPPVFPQPSFEAMGPQMGGMFRAFKDSTEGRALVIDQNMFVEQILPNMINRTLAPKEMEAYRAPFVRPADREMVLKWPREVPIAGEPPEVVARMGLLKKFMTTTDLPILLLYAEPGVLVSSEVRAWYIANLHNLETVYVGQGFHFIQEDHPDAIGKALVDWLRRH